MHKLSYSKVKHYFKSQIIRSEIYQVFLWQNQVLCFCFQDSPRRAHSIAAQGGINAAKNYPNDGDSVFRLFYDTIKGGDYRSREANVYRLAQVSTSIIDQCVAQGVPFAREYGGNLSNRSFGGAQVSRTLAVRAYFDLDKKNVLSLQLPNKPSRENIFRKKDEKHYPHHS